MGRRNSCLEGAASPSWGRLFSSACSTQGRSQLSRSWASRCASNTPAGSQLATGKDLGRCWRGISHTRNLFLPANPNSKRGLLSWLCELKGWSGLVSVKEALSGETFDLLTPGRKCLIKISYGLGMLVFHQQGLFRGLNKKRLEYHKLLVRGKKIKKKSRLKKKNSRIYLKFMDIYLHLWEYYPTAVLLLLQETKVSGNFLHHSFFFPGVLHNRAFELRF